MSSGGWDNGEDTRLLKKGLYRLKNGRVGTYREAILECIEFYTRRKLAAEQEIAFYEAELKKCAE